MCANRSGCLLLVLGAVFAVQVNDIGGQTIQCACTTVECMLLNTKVCNTSQLCYSQFLETSDSINPMTRGCINSASTLLCENRKPETLESSWPVLHCCSEPMCNEGVIPPVPSWHPNTIEQDKLKLIIS
ncbi:BMP and activin membrane-bound inhibitor homolog [Saccoglossus kowalevskii]